MNVVWNILGQPLVFCFFILHRLAATAFIIAQALVGRQAVSTLTANKFMGALLLALVMAGIVYLALKYLLETVFEEPLALKDLPMLLGGLFWRLVAILIVYVILAVLFYVWTSFYHIVIDVMGPPHVDRLR